MPPVLVEMNQGITIPDCPVISTLEEKSVIDFSITNCSKEPCGHKKLVQVCGMQTGTSLWDANWYKFQTCTRGSYFMKSSISLPAQD